MDRHQIHALIKGDLGHIALVAEDFEGALTAHLGLGPFAVYLYDETLVPRLLANGEPTIGKWWLAINQRRPQFEIISPISDCPVFQEWVGKGGAGIHHLGFFVKDAAESTRLMERAGYETLLAGSGHGLDGDGAFAYHDTRAELGYITETITPPARRKPPIGMAGLEGLSPNVVEKFREVNEDSGEVNEERGAA